MHALKNNHIKRTGLGDRLAACVEKVGGKRAMAAAALISEAQLFRYLNGDSDVPSDRLVAIAKAAQVDAGWLLTGEGKMEGGAIDSRPAFRSELMVQIVQRFEELMVEFEKPFKPSQRARAITFLYNALRHEETMRGLLFEVQKFDILKYTHFLAELRTDEELEILISTLDILEYPNLKNPDAASNKQLLKLWFNLIVRGMKGYYSSYPGQVYFERRAGGHLDATSVLELQNIVMNACKLTRKTNLDWLDLGCGNGRHLAHLYKHMPNLQLKGLELSDMGFTYCKSLMDAERLAPNTVIQGDMRNLPYGAQSFDVVFSNMSLYCMPYVSGSGLGMEEVMLEVNRVLRNGGLFTVIFPMGEWRDYSMPGQFMSEASARKLAADFGFEVIKTVITDEDSLSQAVDEAKISNNIKFIYKYSLQVQFFKIRNMA